MGLEIQCLRKTHETPDKNNNNNNNNNNIINHSNVMLLFLIIIEYKDVKSHISFPENGH